MTAANRRAVLWRSALVAAVVVAGFTTVVLSVPQARARAETFLDQFRGDPGPSTTLDTARLGGAGPGTLVSAKTMPTYDGKQMHAARVVYRSTSGDTGKETVVSGMVFTPVGHAPDGGWPVLAFGHATTGIDEDCAPRITDPKSGLAPTIAILIDGGYAVAIPDYQGLGMPGIHPYTDARTAGLNMIDAVRALIRTFDNISDRWAAIGSSQGGGAAWAADEQAAAYAPDLHLIGAVALAPAADVTGLVDKATAGTMTVDQVPALQAIVESLARLHPELDRDDYRSAAAAQVWSALSSCSPEEAAQRAQAAANLRPGDIAPRTTAAADELRGLLRAWALPQRELSAPLFVEYGAADTFIDPQWTTDAIVRACRLGGTITWYENPSAGHGDIDPTPGLAWLQDRFDGKPAENGCP